MSKNKKNHTWKHKKQNKGKDPIMKERIIQPTNRKPDDPDGNEIKRRKYNPPRVFGSYDKKNVPLQTRKQYKQRKE